MEKGKTTGIPAWKRGLLVGLIGLTAVGAAAGIRNRQMEQEAAMAMGDASDQKNGLDSSQKNQISVSNREAKKIALTFDDGPHPRYTEELLDGLAERNVKVGF